MQNKLINSIKVVKRFINTNKSLSIKISVGMIIIITILVIASCFKKIEYGNSVGNSSNSGLAVQDGKWIYYVELDDGNPVGICKVKNNGKKIEKVADGSMYYLNIIENYIYCLEYNKDDDQNNLIRVKTNGKKKEILARGIDDNQIMATNKGVYYFKNNKLYKVNLEGTERKEISNKDILYYQIDGRWIYYIYKNENSQYIAKMKLDGEDSQRIAKINDKQEYKALYVKGNKIYYILSEMNANYEYEYYLYKMNKKGEKIDKICKIDSNIQSINMQEDKIYYTTTYDYSTYNMKHIKYNGTDKTTLTKKESIETVNLTEDWIFFLGVNEDYDSIITMISKEKEKEKNL